MLTPKLFSSWAMISMARNESAPTSSKRTSGLSWSSSISMISAIRVRICATCASFNGMTSLLLLARAPWAFRS